MMPDHPVYLVTAAAAVALALLFPVTRHMRQNRQRRQYWLLQGITVVGAIIGAKLSVLFGDTGWPFGVTGNWREVLWSGRSITGALICGFLAAELAKPLLGYQMRPNDRFAALLPFSIGLGRIGCLFSGCCAGLPWGGWCAMADHSQTLRHPTQVYEMLFQFGIGGLFVLCIRRGWFSGHLFALYLMAYGVFRFVTEFVRATPRWFGPLSGYQLLALVMLGLGAAFFFKRTFRPPAWWHAAEDAHTSTTPHSA